MSNNSLRVPNNSLKVQNGGVFTNIGIVLLVVFLIFGWPILAIYLMMTSVSAFKAAPKNDAPKVKETKWKYYLGLTMMMMWVFMIFAIMAKFSS